MALNAIVQTHHLGTAGRVLEKLAQHVDELHRTCNVLVADIVRVLGGIAARVAGFTSEETEKRRSISVGSGNWKASRTAAAS